MANRTLAMTGASGMLGAPIIRALAARDVRPRVLSSNDASAAKLRALGVEVVVGHFHCNGDLDRLLIGMDTVLHIPPSVVLDEDAIGFAVIAAAERQGLRHFCFMSCYRSIIPELRHHANKLAVEQALTRSSLRATILQPAMFMQNLRFIWPAVQASGVVAWPWDPDRRYAMVDVADIAEATATILTVDRYAGGTYEMCGGQELTVSQMAAMLGAAMGREIRAGHQAAGDWIAGMRRVGAPEWTIETVAGMCAYHDAYGYAGGSDMVMRAILGRAPTPYANFARRWVAERGASA